MAALAMLAMGFASCSSDDIAQNGDDTNGKAVTYTLSGSFDTASDDTRMSLTGSTLVFKWNTGDFITVWDASGTRLADIEISGGVGSANGTFTATLSDAPASVTFNSKATTSSTDAEKLSITLDPAADGVAYTDDDMGGLPILAQSAATKQSDTRYKFSLKHKLAYVDFTDLKVNGDDMVGCTMDGVSTLTINTTTGVGTAGSGTYTGTAVSTGKV